MSYKWKGCNLFLATRLADAGGIPVSESAAQDVPYLWETSSDSWFSTLPGTPQWKMHLPMFLMDGSQRNKACTLLEMQLRLTSSFLHSDDTAAAVHNAELG